MKKFKLISSIIVALIVISVITFGVIVAISPEYGITNSITFRPENDINFSVVCEATWALGSGTPERPDTITLTIDENGDVKPTNKWEAPDINFNDVLPEKEVKLSFTFTNTSLDEENVLIISFYDILSDSSDPIYSENPRFIAETQIDNGERELVTGREGDLITDFELAHDETKTINIYYTLKRQDESFTLPQNIIINIDLQ